MPFPRVHFQPKLFAITSIFARIYAGLILLVITAVFIAFLLFRGINQYRAQEYRENIASAMMFLLSEGINRQHSPIEREYWLSDAEYLLGFDLNIQPLAELDFSRWQLSRLKKGHSIVEVNPRNQQYHIYYRLGETEQVLSATLSPNSIREQQIKTLPIFLLDDFSHYPHQVNERLAVFKRHLPFDIHFEPFPNNQLYDDQIKNIRRQQVVISLNEQHRNGSLTLMCITPKRDQILVVGPIPLFNPLPYKLVLGISIITLLIISIGVYSLIVPLHQKVKQVQQAMTQVRKGDLGARVHLLGKDEIATLGKNFNEMTEHIQRLISAQRELTRAVSHELRTPVARIRFGLEMLVDTDSLESRIKQQQDIDKDIETLDELIDEILTYAKLEGGTPALDIQSISLNAIIDQVAKETIQLGRPIEVVVHIEPAHVQYIAEADYRYLHRVLQNLAGNASRYAKSKVVISAGLQSNQAFIRVEDDGPGIPHQDRDKIFLPFARLDDSRTRASGGYGLGLSIVARICYWFKGTMQVDSSPMLGGARFTMRWPAKLTTHVNK